MWASLSLNSTPLSMHHGLQIGAHQYLSMHHGLQIGAQPYLPMHHGLQIGAQPSLSMHHGLQIGAHQYLYLNLFPDWDVELEVKCRTRGKM